MLLVRPAPFLNPLTVLDVTMLTTNVYLWDFDASFGNTSGGAITGLQVQDNNLTWLNGVSSSQANPDGMRVTYTPVTGITDGGPWRVVAPVTGFGNAALVTPGQSGTTS